MEAEAGAEAAAGGGGSGSGGGDPLFAAIVFGVFGILVLYIVLRSGLYHRKVRRRDLRVRTASAEAAEDDAYFAADELERHATALFTAAQLAWDARDRAALAKLVGPDLLVEWNRRLDDFDRKHWHNRVEVLADAGGAVRGDDEPRGRHRGSRRRAHHGPAALVCRGRERPAHQAQAGSRAR